MKNITLINYDLIYVWIFHDFENVHLWCDVTCTFTNKFMIKYFFRVDKKQKKNFFIKKNKEQKKKTFFVLKNLLRMEVKM